MTESLVDLYESGARLPCTHTGYVEELDCGCEVEEVDDGPNVYVRICQPHRIELRQRGVIDKRGKRIAYRKDAVSD